MFLCLLLVIGHGRTLNGIRLHVHVHASVLHPSHHLLLVLRLLLSKLGPDLTQHILLLFLSHARLIL